MKKSKKMSFHIPAGVVMNEAKWRLVNQTLIPIIKIREQVGNFTIENGIAEDRLIGNLYHILGHTIGRIKLELLKKN